MRLKEIFGYGSADSNFTIDGWEGEIPAIDYWLMRYSRKHMSERQREFFKFLKQRISQGPIPSNQRIESYLSIYRDELLQAYKEAKVSQRLKIYEEIKVLIANTDIGTVPFTSILEEQYVRLKKERLDHARSNPKARWIAPGEEVTIGDKTYTRGGFYLGGWTEASAYRLETKRRGLNQAVEGPVFDLGNSAPPSPKAATSFSTYAEIHGTYRADIENWLSGGEISNPRLLSYYLSGIEFKLLADKSTTDDERASLIKYLEQLADLPEFGKSHIAFRPYSAIIDLIDFTICRFFPDDAPLLVSHNRLRHMKMYRQMQQMRWLESIAGDDKKANLQVIKQKAINNLAVPEGFPPEFHDEYLRRLKRQFEWELDIARYSVDNRIFYYQGIAAEGFYEPEKAVRSVIAGYAIPCNPTLLKVTNALNKAIGHLQSETAKFMALQQAGASALALSLALPQWCKVEKYHRYAEGCTCLCPDDGQKYKLMSFRALLAEIGISMYAGSDYPDQYLVEQVLCTLGMLGLKMSYSPSSSIRLKYDDTVAIYSIKHGDAPTRGLMPACLYAIAWIVQTDPVTDSEYATIDQWIRNYDPKASWHIGAEGTLRWLCSRKLTLSGKRKAKFLSFNKFPLKRDSLLQLLLRLAAAGEKAYPKRLKRLKAFYELLGMDPTDIHSDLHRLVTSGSQAAMKPTAKATKGGVLDKAKLKQMAASTQKAQEILSDVFADDEAPAKDKGRAKKKMPTLLSLLAVLAAKEQWSRPDFEAECLKIGETAGAAMEKLNDLSYAKLDDAVIEDADDTIIIYTDLASQLL